MLGLEERVSYEYNKDGIRTKKAYDGKTHTYTLDGTNIIKEKVTGSNPYTAEYFYDLDGTACGLKYGGNAYYFYKNLQGDVIAITDDTGATVARYTYDAWGKVLSVTDANGNAITSATHVANINPFRYRSYYYDAESRLYYLQSRYYDPEVGRFLNADNPIMILFTTINGHNAMCYCSNTPIIKTDSYGAFDESLYGFKLFDGTDDGHGKGFEIYMDPIFKSPDYCLSYAGDFLKKYGSGWWIFKKYDGMGIERIAAEIWFHAVVYYIGPYVKLLLSILGISKSAFDSIYKSSNPATINSKDNRELFFWIVWNARWLERFLRSSVSPKGCMNPFRVVFKQMIK